MSIKMRIMKVKLQRSENPVDGDQRCEIYDDLFLQKREIISDTDSGFDFFLSFISVKAKNIFYHIPFQIADG